MDERTVSVMVRERLKQREKRIEELKPRVLEMGAEDARIALLMVLLGADVDFAINTVLRVAEAKDQVCPDQG